MTTTITKTRALAELTMLNSKIEKRIDSADPYVIKTKTINWSLQEEHHRKEAISENDSLHALIVRRNAIKVALGLSNATTIVEIAGKKMCVLEAIEHKNITLAYKKRYLDTLRRRRNQTFMQAESERKRVQDKIDMNIQSICGKDAKIDPGAIQSITDNIRKSDPVEVFDPLGIDNVIKKLEEEIEDFATNVDFVLSESNATTTILV